MTLFQLYHPRTFLVIAKDYLNRMAQGKRTVSDDEIIESFLDSPDPAFTTSELAAMHGMTTEGMRNRLEELQKKAPINYKKPGSRSVIWWHQEDEEVPLSSQ